MGALLEIARVTPCDPLPGELRGGFIDAPRAGAVLDAESVDMLGWALGAESPAVAVELSLDGEAFWRAPLRLERPDLAEKFPGRAEVERAGFATTLDLIGKRRELSVGISIVLDDDRRAQLATIDARRAWRRERSPAFAQLASVVIDCGGLAEEQLRAAVEDVQAQSYPHVEIVLVGQGSDEVAGDDGALRRVDDEFGFDPAEARNLGIRSSNGDYLVFVDSAAAAALPPAFVEAGVQELEKNPACAAAVDASPPPSPAIYRRALFEHLRGFDSALGDAAAGEFDLAVAHRFAVCEFDAAHPLRAGG